MTRKATLPISFSLLIFVFLICSCSKSSSPVSPKPDPRSIFRITIDEEPICLIQNWNTNKLTCKINVSISETNGVGCNITSIEQSFTYQNATYEPISEPGQRINAYETKNITFNLSTNYLYQGIRIIVKGTDDNGHSISTSKDFSVENLPGLSGTYQGDLSGTEYGWVPFVSVLTLNITQNGKNFEGNWHTNKGTSGIFTATFEELEEEKWGFEMDATQYNPDYGTYTANGEIANWGYFILGNFVGSSGALGKIDATFSVSRR